MTDREDNERRGIDASESSGDENDDWTTQSQSWTSDKTETITSTVSSIPSRFYQGLVSILLLPLVLISKWIPKSQGIANSFIMAGLNYKKKLSRGDIIVFVIYGDKQVIPKPMRWNSDTKTYQSSDGKEFSADAIGHSPYRIGKTPVAWALAKGATTFEPIQAHIANARDQGKWMEYQQAEGGKDIAVDGGIVDDGTLLSWEKAHEMLWKKIDNDDLDEQYRTGYLEGLEGDPGGNLKFALIGAAVAAVLIFGTLFLISQLSGSGGGGISSVVMGQLVVPGVV